jgi:hypothetical protein
LGVFPPPPLEVLPPPELLVEPPELLVEPPELLVLPPSTPELLVEPPELLVLPPEEPLELFSPLPPVPSPLSTGVLPPPPLLELVSPPLDVLPPLELLVEPPELLVLPPELLELPPELLPPIPGRSSRPLSLPSVPSLLPLTRVAAVDAVALQAVSALGKALTNSLRAFFVPKSSAAKQERSASLSPDWLDMLRFADIPEVLAARITMPAKADIFRTNFKLGTVVFLLGAIIKVAPSESSLHQI